MLCLRVWRGVIFVWGDNECLTFELFTRGWRLQYFLGKPRHVPRRSPAGQRYLPWSIIAAKYTTPEPDLVEEKPHTANRIYDRAAGLQWCLQAVPCYELFLVSFGSPGRACLFPDTCNAAKPQLVVAAEEPRFMDGAMAASPFSLGNLAECQSSPGAESLD